jgi:peptide/nickel transport system substrate-binding protein
MRRVAVLSVLLSTALFVAACGGGSSTGGGSAASGPAKQGGTLTVGLAEDPDVLDPTQARTFVGRIVFANMCEKLYDVDAKLNIIPQLAASMPKLSNGGKTVTIALRKGIKFNDGTPFNAKAVKISLDRHRTFPGSFRATEISPVKAVKVVDPSTVQLTLSKPFGPLPAQLADRAGMIMSPTQLKKLGAKFGNDPVCVGPFSFVSRKEGDRIELKKSNFYYDKSKVKLDHLVFRIMTEGSVRASNLRSHDIDVADRLDPTDVKAIQSDPSLQLKSVTSLGYQGITINIANKSGVTKPYQQLNTPLARSKELRQAFSMALDRDQIVKVVYQGQYVAGCSPLSPVSPYKAANPPCPKRDLAKAKQLVAQSGMKAPVPVKLMVPPDSLTLRLGQVIQAMEKDAGFNVQLQPTEFTTALDKSDAGQYDTFQIGWSGRVDPDGNMYDFLTDHGAQDIGGYANPKVDSLLKRARGLTDKAPRVDAYRQALTQVMSDAPLIYLFHEKYQTGADKNVVGMQIYGDGLLRFKTAGFAASSGT